ncbi:class I SAM-dependent methyltransferase [Roseibium sp. FZY0029]|uniref:class I SAM-dependent methyltransferase n=1 Tax=Roseibium sp. FZY0029 TaxID=3116647 RepID=UPI002EB9825F|nr:class I SAM-dependent methyltransferase [Roseibium sp. FZY0029]
MSARAGSFSFDRKDLSRFLFDLYDYEPKLLRKLISARPYVCPFEDIERHIPEDAKVLDVGCGNGALLAILLASGRVKVAVGCDVHEGALASARMAAERTGNAGHVSFLKIRGFEELPADSFDVVTMVDVLHHVPEGDRVKAVEEAIKRVAAGGIFLFKDMVEAPFWRRLAHNVDDLIFSGEWVRQVKTAKVEAQVKAAGFELFESLEIPRIFYGNTLRVFRRL